MKGDQVKKYLLPGGSSVEIHQIFGKEIYFAIIDQCGRYPDEGRVAHDINRFEYLYVISGEIRLTVNSKVHFLMAGQAYLISDGDRYFLAGKARVLVLVHDQKEGRSVIEDLT